jgi:hypothetical protein
MKEILKIIKISLLILIPLVAVYLAIVYAMIPEKQSCDDIDAVLGYKFDSCYDMLNKTLVFSVGKYSNNNVNGAIKLAFSGIEKVVDVPQFGTTKYYRIPFENPVKITVTQFLRKGKTVCSKDTQILMEPCTEEQINPSIDFHNLGKTNVSANQTQNISNDKLPSNLVKKGSLFSLDCSSEWVCSDWEMCINGIQKRNCQDKNACLVATNIPETEKKCLSCTESWQCTWSECANNNSIPSCEDSNNCNTEFSKPEPIACTGQCVPDFLCSNWSECQVKYSFVSLAKVQEFSGIQTRICRDNNGCGKDTVETMNCTLKISTFSKETELCGTKYIEVYSSSTNELLARIRNDYNSSDPNIAVFIGNSEINCDSCNNKVKDSSETGVDCGGSCSPCIKQSYSKDYISDFMEWIRSF